MQCMLSFLLFKMHTINKVAELSTKQFSMFMKDSSKWFGNLTTSDSEQIDFANLQALGVSLYLKGFYGR